MNARELNRCFTCEALQEVLLQLDGSIQSFPRLLLRQALVQVPAPMSHMLILTAT